jgi:hypothetical protein
MEKEYNRKSKFVEKEEKETSRENRPGHERNSKQQWVHKPIRSRQCRNPKANHQMEPSHSTTEGLQKLLHGRTRLKELPHQHVHNLAMVSSLSLFVISPCEVEHAENK